MVSQGLSGSPRDFKGLQGISVSGLRTPRDSQGFRTPQDFPGTPRGFRTPRTPETLGPGLPGTPRDSLLPTSMHQNLIPTVCHGAPHSSALVTRL